MIFAQTTGMDFDLCVSPDRVVILNRIHIAVP